MVVLWSVIGFSFLVFLGLFSYLLYQSFLWVLLLYISWGSVFVFFPLIKILEMNYEVLKKSIKRILIVQGFLWFLFLLFSDLQTETIIWTVSSLIIGMFISAGLGLGILGDQIAETLNIEDEKESK